MTTRIASEAGQSIETAMRRAKKVAKSCATCGIGVDNRKTYCAPCYDARLQANISANRHKYRGKRK